MECHVFAPQLPYVLDTLLQENLVKDFYCDFPVLKKIPRGCHVPITIAYGCQSPGFRMAYSYRLNKSVGLERRQARAQALVKISGKTKALALSAGRPVRRH